MTTDELVNELGNVHFVSGFDSFVCTECTVPKGQSCVSVRGGKCFKMPIAYTQEDPTIWCVTMRSDVIIFANSTVFLLDCVHKTMKQMQYTQLQM